jgi:hypothetical protein
MALQGYNRKHSPGGLKLTHQVALESHCEYLTQGAATIAAMPKWWHTVAVPSVGASTEVSRDARAISRVSGS